jgi:hypothetical protein
MLKSLILAILFLNVAIARDRFSQEDKKRFLNEVSQEIAQHKVENQGRVDLQIIKPAFYVELEELISKEKITRKESLVIKKRYEDLSKNKSVSAQNAEEAFNNFVQKELLEIDSRPLDKIKEGGICNEWSCAAGLKCAPDPIQEAFGKLKKAGVNCKESSECASGECYESQPGSKIKICEEVFRCFRPLVLGESCALNPVCGSGSCLAYNSLTSGIGECNVLGKSCKKNSDCCSNSCGQGICKENVICKDCVSNGGKPQRGQRCCEGLYLNERGTCAPDVPPSVIPQVNVSPTKDILVAVAELLFSRAQAEDLTSEIKADRDKYSNFQATSTKENKTLDMNEKKPNLVFERKSDFRTCDLRFKDDFYNAMKKDGTFDLEVAMLAFDFVSTGDSDNDYWTSGSAADSSVFGRLKKIGLAHRAVRQDNNKQFDEINKKLTCACLDVQGLAKINDATKKKFFEEQCDEAAKYKDPATANDQMSGDASSIKAKELIVLWTENLIKFHSALAVKTEKSFGELDKVAEWTRQAPWTETRTKSYDLFKFNIKNPSSSVAGLGAIVGALLAAGVIAVLGGFATTSLLSSWAAAGIITASAVTGAGGLWMLASLKGAWITMRPQISDSVIAPRSYSCGKKDNCMEYTRTLIQPYNEICKIHASANACLKSFVVVNENSESRYIIDPWIPVGVSKISILKGQPLYTEKLERSFEAAKAAMVSKNPGATGGGGKNGGGEFVAESYLSEIFIDQNIVGKYLPGIGSALEETYFMNDDKVKIIKEAAKKFAIDEGFLEAEDTANLSAFADYAYEYHFVWPKKSRPDEISYPTVGLTTYLTYMANDVSGNLATGLVNTTKGLIDLNQKHVKSLETTLKELKNNKPINLNSLVSENLEGKLAAVKQKLENFKALDSYLTSANLNVQLSQLGKTFGDTQGNSQALKGSSLSGDQVGFLKAVSNLRTARDKQLKSLETYNKAMVSNGDKDRFAKMATVSKNFSERFSKGKFAFGNPKSAVASAGSGSGSGSKEKENKDGSGNLLDSNGSEGSGYGANSSRLYGYGSGSGSSGTSGSGSSSSTGSDQNNHGSGIDVDQSKLAEAISARDQSSKDKYSSSEEQTLFEKITNAYIRNYDKVLSKKKDKDIIEDKR